MAAVTISPKYQVVIPKEVRETLKLYPGQKLQVLLYEGHVELIPELSIAEMRGFLPGLDSDVPREPDRV